MNVQLIFKTIKMTNILKYTSIIEIIKEGIKNKYIILKNDTNLEPIKLICIDKNILWDEYESLEDMKKELICDAVKGFFEDIEIYNNNIIAILNRG